MKFKNIKTLAMFPLFVYSVLRRYWYLLLLCAGAFLLHKSSYVLLKELGKVRVELDSIREEAKRKSKISQASDISVTPVSSRWIEVQKKARNSLVQVFTNVSAFNWAEPYRVPEQGEGRGSGFFIDAEGHFLTNYHVVSQAIRVQIQVPCLGEERLDAKVVGVSPERDLALVKLDDKGQDIIRKELGSISYLEFGSSDDVERGQEVLALGYPLGLEHLKSTQGIVSGWERVSFSERGFGQLCFQTSAPINPGSSGGPSLNTDGEVIGINFAGATGAQNVGYVIPINEIQSAIKDLHKVELLRKPRLGASFLPLSRSMAKYLKLPEGGGFYVGRVVKGSLFEKIGVKEGDTVREINGHLMDYNGNVVVSWSEDKVSGLDLLNRLVVGDEVSLVLFRNGKRKELTFELEKDAVPPVRLIFPEHEKVDYEVFAGLCVMELSLNHIIIFGDKNTDLLKYASVENQYDKALIVTNIMPTSETHNSPRILKVGNLIEEINGKKVSTLEELRAAIKSGLSSEFVTILMDDKRFAVLSAKKVLKDEPRLASLFLFNQNHSVSLTTAMEK